MNLFIDLLTHPILCRYIEFKGSKEHALEKFSKASSYLFNLSNINPFPL